MTSEITPIERISNGSKEKQLLNLLINSEALQVEWIPKIEPEIFFGNFAMDLFGLIRSMFLGKRRINQENIEFELNQSYHPGTVFSSMKFLGEVLQTTPLENTETLIEQLTSLYKSRKIYKEVFLDANRMFHDNRPVEEVIEKIAETLFATEVNVKEKRIVDLPSEALDSIFHPKDEDQGLDIGLAEFDTTYGGIKPDTYLTIGAESGTGKTAVIVDFIYRLCTLHQNKVAICFFSLEMSETRVMKRLLSRHAQVNGMKFDKNRVTAITPEEKNKLYNAAADIKNWPLKIVYENMDINKLKVKARQFVLQNPGKRHIFIVDTIAKLEFSGSDIRLATIRASNGLKSICVNHKSTVISLTQLLKEVASDKYKGTYHRPNESHIMESGAIKADSDILILLWRPGSRFDKIAYGSNPEWDAKGKMIFLNEKNRDGLERTDMVFTANMATNTLGNSDEPF